MGCQALRQLSSQLTHYRFCEYNSARLVKLNSSDVCNSHEIWTRAASLELYCDNNSTFLIFAFLSNNSEINLHWNGMFHYNKIVMFYFLISFEICGVNGIFWVEEEGGDYFSQWQEEGLKLCLKQSININLWTYMK